jgi:hypothetical protein
MNHAKLPKVLVLAVVLALMLGSQQTVLASTRVENGGQVPYYARLERGYSYTDGTWVAVVFYRPPECIPAGFNLLDFFDFENCWDCQPPTTDGFSIWKNGPEVDPAPILQFLQGLGEVPVWFVSWPEYQTAVADDVITMGELASLSSLQEGSASFYQETLRPIGGAVTNTMLIEAHGSLVDGTVFKLQIQHTEKTFRVMIEF